jgi:cytochrome c oxidase subunit I
LLVAPWLIAPLLPLLGVQNVRGRQIFTELMRFGIFPAVSFALALCVRSLWAARRELSIARDPRVMGFLASVALSVLGYVLGACIRGSSTIVPAHYHACIGAVTVSFMTLGYELVAPLGLRAPEGRLAALVRRYQPLVFGIGQSVFALGFAFAGVHGAGRKVYGSEQHVRTASEALGLVVMGTGGLLAIVGGVAFLAYVTAAFTARDKRFSVRARYAAVLAHLIGGTHGR